MSNFYRPKIQSTDTHTYTIKINTNLGEGDYWIRLRRNNQYIPYKQQGYQKKQTDLVSSPTPTPDTQVSNETTDWTMVSAKKREKSIYYWIVDSHNLFDRRNKAYRLYFTEPDATEIENIDQTNYMAINSSGQLCLLHAQLKHNGMKMNPTFYIARNLKQIEDALKHVKYCVVFLDNNEQKLIDDPKLIQLPITI